MLLIDYTASSYESYCPDEYSLCTTQIELLRDYNPNRVYNPTVYLHPIIQNRLKPDSLQE